MATQVDPEEHEYSYVNDGYRYTDTTDQYSHYQHLQKDKQPTTIHTGHSKGNVEPQEIADPPVKSASHNCCKRPPWWVWLLVAIGLVIIAGLVAVLVFVLQFLPKQDGQASPTPMTTNVAEYPHSTTPYIPTRDTHTPAKTSATTPPNTDCQALYTAGYTTSGVYTISPDGVTQMTVYCEQILDGGGWTVFQQRLNGGVTFDQTWTDYTDGFGDASGDLWLGLNNIHALTAGRHLRLKIEMEYPATNLVHVDYSTFYVADGADKYRLYISGFSTSDPISDELAYHSGSRFSTVDQDNDICGCHCAQVNSGGWWYNNCAYVKLNGRFNATGQYVNIRWNLLAPHGISLVTVRMMAKGN